MLLFSLCFVIGWRLGMGHSIAEGQRGLDQGRVGERLRKIAQEAARRRIHLLAEKPQRRGLLQHGLEQGNGVFVLTGVRQRLDQPERAGQECPLRSGKAVLSGRITLEQRESGGQFRANGLDCSRQAG